ncbi:YfhO family protein [Limosilactobacillus caccae]|uniref:YfhO family protein n=1 Tax=Limosilactobacillus caccae TaxID=1926284 RepID=UPI0009714184|nr:YfhO family protein [Limosilactobacillus caccae]
MHIKSRPQRRFILLASFLLPVILMTSYIAYRKMVPFGDSSLLTVDLGQQYVDFFAYFRATILHHPSSLFYSFSKGLGGEMLGTNAYYLLSPLNFIFLFFPAQHLSLGIALITILRYGLAGLSFAWLLDKTELQQGWRAIAFSTAYALNGWMIANQLNMLWQDALIILPLIIWGLIKLIHQQKLGTYTAWLAVMMVDNYYMAWMIALFTILFFVWQLPTLQNWQQRKIASLHYLGSSLLAGGLAAIVLLPTFYALMQSKGTYTETSIHNRFEYFAPKMLAKLVPGAFNFGQMPSGQPNFYVGMVMMMGALGYFFTRRIDAKQRLIAAVITIFFILSFCYEPLDLLWHAGQFPVWYPYRFSFLFSFWCIYLAATVIQPAFKLNKYASLALVVLCVSLYFYLGTLKLSYINSDQRNIGLCFALIAIGCLSIPRANSPRLYDALLILLAVCDISMSGYTALNKISYVSQPEFGDYTVKLDQAVNKVKQGDDGLYRVAKTFMRTKDDPFQADFNSGDHFGSTLEPAIPAFMGAIGQPDGDGFITYANGTQVTDALLGYKYTMNARENEAGNALPASGYRPDWYSYPIFSATPAVTIRQNDHVLPLAFGANEAILNLRRTTLDPLNYQSQIFQALAGRPIMHPLFTVQNFTNVKFNNVQTAKQITGTIFRKQNLLKPASVELEFTPPTNDSYYLTLGPDVKDDASISMNNHRFTQYDTYRNTVVVNLAHQQKGKKITVTLRLKKSSLWMQNVSVYRLNQRPFAASLKSLQRSPLKIKEYTSNKISGTVTLHHNQQVLMTTIPAASGWHVKVDGHAVKPRTAINTFMAVPMTAGTHQVVFYYRPPYLILGAIITLLSLISFSLLLVAERKNKWPHY